MLLGKSHPSFIAVFALGMILSILVYFSPCAFPVLPGFISYYLSLGAREDERSKKANSRRLCLRLGYWYSCRIGYVDVLHHHWNHCVFTMGEAFAQSGMIHIIAIGIAVLLIFSVQ